MDSHNITLLLVEDVRVAQKVARMTLEAMQCEVDIAATGAQALACIQQKRYHMVLMDLGLDDTDGVTLTEAIRRMDSLNRQVPIIALTAHSASDEAMKMKCLQAGMDDFLEKPIREDSIKKLFNRYSLTKNNG